MTTFKDVDGIRVKAIKLDGGTKWLGNSAVVAAMDSTDAAALTFSIAAYASCSAMGTAINIASGYGADAMQGFGQLLKALAGAGLITLNYDGTNKYPA